MRYLFLGILGFFLFFSESFSTDPLSLRRRSFSCPNLCLSTPAPPQNLSKSSISFAGGSYFSATYSMGVLKFLQEAFDLSEMIFLGDSSGCFPALTAALDMPAEDAIQNCMLKSLRDKHALPFYGFSQWSDVLKKNLLFAIEEYDLADQAHKIVKDRLYISVTRLDSEPWFLHNELVSSYHSDEDLTQAIVTSCHIPWILSKDFSTQWRGHTYIDGGLTNHNPKLDENTLCIHPLLFRSGGFWVQHGRFNLPTVEEAREAVEWGYQDAVMNRDYFEKCGLVPKKLSLNQLPVLEASQLSRVSDLSLDKRQERTYDVSSYLKLQKSLGTFCFYSSNIVFSQLSRFYFCMQSFLLRQGVRGGASFVMKACLFFLLIKMIEKSTVPKEDFLWILFKRFLKRSDYA